MDTDKPSAEETAKKFGFEEDYYSGDLSWWQKTKPKIWSIFDEPYSSTAAKVRWLPSLVVTTHFYSVGLSHSRINVENVCSFI